MSRISSGWCVVVRQDREDDQAEPLSGVSFSATAASLDVMESMSDSLLHDDMPGEELQRLLSARNVACFPGVPHAILVWLCPDMGR